MAAHRNLLTADDVDLIREVVAAEVRKRKLALQPPSLDVVDLGAGGMTSALAVLAEAPHARIVSVDHSPEAILNGWTVMFAAGQLDQHDRWRGVVCDAADWASHHPFGVDVLLLDTGHERADTERELAAWLPLLSPGVPVWIHDYVGEHDGVRLAVDAAVERGALTVERQHGLGIALRVP